MVQALPAVVTGRATRRGSPFFFSLPVVRVSRFHIMRLFPGLHRFQQLTIGFIEILRAAPHIGVMLHVDAIICHLHGKAPIANTPLPARILPDIKFAAGSPSRNSIREFRCPIEQRHLLHHLLLRFPLTQNSHPVREILQLHQSETTQAGSDA